MGWREIRAALPWPSLRDKVQTSLWIVPIGYSVSAAALALALLKLDTYLSSFSAWFLYRGGAEGARALLSTIASSMLNIAGLVFSITILVLQLASSQFSPRVLRTFLQDRVTQRSLGMFLGSFVYAMVLLPSVRSSDDDLDEFIPEIAIFVAFGLVMISIGFFVRYIHHMAHSIRVVNIIARVAEETLRSLERLYPDQVLDEPESSPPHPQGDPDLILVNTRRAGVIISTNERALMAAACANDLVIVALHAIGDFVPQGSPLWQVWGTGEKGELTPDDWVVLSEERTPHQDAIFGFRQLVDIAERALSPGINDPTTATQALDRLHDLLRCLSRRRIPSPMRVDAQNRLRLVLPRPDWTDYVTLSFEEILTYSTGSVQVLRRARVVLEDLLTAARPERAAPLHKMLAHLEAVAAR